MDAQAIGHTKEEYKNCKRGFSDRRRFVRSHEYDRHAGSIKTNERAHKLAHRGSLSFDKLWCITSNLSPSLLLIL